MTSSTTTTTPPSTKTVTLKGGATVTVYWSTALGASVAIPA